jgi:DNA polymerase-3 subunit alpha
VLRKAMGKKDRKTLDKMKGAFMQGAQAKNLEAKKLEKIWTDWEAFAQYAFNKSHSTCYAFVAFQTAYLKANYPAEYMSAVLTNNQGNIDKITFFMEECRRMGIPVKGPDINESDVKFSVNQSGEIRYALSAIKGVGEAAVEAIVDERKKNGAYKSIYDLTRRANLRAVNKKALEALGYAGAFDSFTNYHRAQYFLPDKKDGLSLLDKAARYGSNIQGSGASQQNSLFGETQGGVNLTEPTSFGSNEWSLLEKLKKEKEVTGLYISGHPLDDYRLEIKTFTNCTLNDIEKVKNRDIKIAGIVTTTETKISKNGNQYCKFTLEDFNGSYTFTLFGKDYLNFKTFIETSNAMLHVAGRYQQRWNNENEFEFKITKIDLLSEIRSKLTKFLTLEISSLEVSDKLINEINSIISKYPGKTKLRIKFVDEEEGIVVGASSSTKAIELNNDLFRELDFLRIVYSLN